MARTRTNSDSEVGTTDAEALAVDTPATREAASEGRPTTKSYADALEVGYLGSPTDPRPNEHYSVAGEANRAAMVADGRSPDRPPSEEKVGPTRAEAQVTDSELRAAAEANAPAEG